MMCHTGFCHGEFAMLSALFAAMPVFLLMVRRWWRRLRSGPTTRPVRRTLAMRLRGLVRRLMWWRDPERILVKQMSREITDEIDNAIIRDVLHRHEAGEL